MNLMKGTKVTGYFITVECPLNWNIPIELKGNIFEISNQINALTCNDTGVRKQLQTISEVIKFAGNINATLEKIENKGEGIEIELKFPTIQRVQLFEKSLML